MSIFTQEATRRLPVYLLLDTSGSMAGDAIEAVNMGVQMMLNTLRGNPQALETAYISIITFGGDAKHVLPLTDLSTVAAPRLTADGYTPMGGAFRLLNESLDRDIIRNDGAQERKGDYKPLVFLLTDGEPNDSDWRTHLAALKKRTSNKLANLIAIGCGSNVNVAILKEISEQPLLMRDMTGDNINALFQWISASIKTASVRASQQANGAAAQGLALPAAPPVLEIVL